MDDLGRPHDQQREEATGEAYAKVAPSVKAASASEVSPQTAPAEANGNGNAHEHSGEPHLASYGHKVA